MIAKETELAGWQPLEETIPKEILRSEVEAWARRIKVEPKQIHIRPMSRKWGSCSTAGRVTLDAGLLIPAGRLPQASDRPRTAAPAGAEPW